MSARWRSTPWWSGLAAKTVLAIAKSYGLIDDEEIAGLKACGAVGNILYTFYDAEGYPVDHPINTRTLSIPVDTLLKAPLRIVAGGGPDKIQAIVAGCRAASAHGAHHRRSYRQSHRRPLAP